MTPSEAETFRPPSEPPPPRAAARGEKLPRAAHAPPLGRLPVCRLPIRRAMTEGRRHGRAAARVPVRSPDRHIKSSCRVRRSTLPGLARSCPWRSVRDRGRCDGQERSSGSYADIGIKRIMPRSGLCRMASFGGLLPVFGHAAVRNNQSPSRKASRLSSGRNRPEGVAGAATRASAFSFIRMSAWM
nr:hypothetical protein RP007_03856 [Rhizobium sp. P007]